MFLLPHSSEFGYWQEFIENVLPYIIIGFLAIIFIVIAVFAVKKIKRIKNKSSNCYLKDEAEENGTVTKK